MLEATFQISIEAQYSILSPILNQHCERLREAFSQVVKMNLEGCKWTYIQNERIAKDLSKAFVFELDWANFQHYFQGKKPLYVFLEKPIIGLANKKGVFWVFFDPRLAQNYFFRQAEKPKDFSKAEIKPFPSIDLKKAFAERLGEIIRKEDRIINKIRQVEEFFAMSDHFLDSASAAIFNQVVRQLIQGLSLEEIRLLRKDITDPGASPSLLERRLKAIFRICLRLYGKNREDHEKDSLRTLLSNRSVVRAKALELVETKIAADLQQSRA